MHTGAFSSLGPHDNARPQAEQLGALVGQQEIGFRGALVGKRREGKTNLLRQMQVLLFQQAEGPIPFFYAFARERHDDALARHFVAAFCIQVRAFLMRQDDVLLEPPATLEQEAERPGLPLSIAELVRHFLALSPAHQLEYAATLPAQFAHREERPLCMLLDDVHVLDPLSPFFAVLDSDKLSWLLSGRYAFVSRVAASAGWPLVHLEPFSGEEALLQARKHCNVLGLQFSRDVWEPWCEMLGTSPSLTATLITAAAVQNLPLNSIEDLGRVYVQELSSGALGNLLSARLAQAVPDREGRVAVLRYLAEFANAKIPPVTISLPPQVWDGLVAEEWAKEDVLGPRIVLDTVERDWLSITVPAGGLRERARSRLLETFLLRAEQRKERPETARFSTVIRRRILDLPQSGLPDVFSWDGQEMMFPNIVSVCAEYALIGELFWCYGFWGQNREAGGLPVVLLIAVCDEAPTDAQLQKWSLHLDSEARILKSASAEGGSHFVGNTSAISHLFWAVVPPGTSLTPVTFERRFSWQAFFRLLVQSGPSDPTRPSTLER